MSIERFSEAKVPTEYGIFRVIVYKESETQNEHLAIVNGQVEKKSEVLCRVHSECLTGEVLHSLKCDCREQLDLAFKKIAAEDAGVVLYLRQEGRGIGLGNKIKAYSLQEKGMDTVEANRALGFEDDMRRYDVAAFILEDLGIESISLMTNNPLKVESLKDAGIEVTQRIKHKLPSNPYNEGYLETKRVRMGHLD